MLFRLKKNKKAVFFCFVLILIFFAFFLKNKYYIPSEISITTQGSDSAKASLYWNTGSGFNEREKVDFTPYKVKKFEKKNHIIEISRSDLKNTAALGSEVWIDQIKIDELPYELNKLISEGKSIINESNKLAISPGAAIRFEASFESLDVTYLSHQWAGNVKVTVDGKSREDDLFAPNTVTRQISYDDGALPEKVENKFPLPQLNITGFKLVFENDKIYLKDVTVTSSEKVLGIPLPQEMNNIILLSPINLENSSFSYVLLVVQILTAFIITSVLFFILKSLNSLKEATFIGSLSNIFYKERRWFFWTVFSLFLIIFGAWLIGQWPGIMTVDSYHYTWREIKTLHFQNVTPLIYNIYVLALTQIYDSPVIVASFQIMAISFLGAYILFYCYRKGANKLIVLLSVILFGTSIPVGIYNITIWKDIPFSIMMLFWGFYIFQLYFRKKYENTQTNLRFPYIILLAFALYLLCNLRHNGIIFIVAVPAILYFLNLITKKSFWIFAGATSLIFFASWLVNMTVPINSSSEVSDFFSKSYKVSPLAAIYSSKYFYTPDPGGDKILINKWMTEEELRNNYTPVAQADKVNYMIGKWSRLSPEEQSRLSHLYILRNLQNPQIFIADRLTMLLGTMGLSNNVFITTNALRDADTDKSSWRPIEAYKFTSDSKSKGIEKIQNKMITASTWFTGNVPIPTLIFNTIPSLMLLALVFLLFRKLPGSALYSFVFLYNMPFLFVALSTCEWRYFYFLLLAAYFILPIVSMECRNKKLQDKIA